MGEVDKPRKGRGATCSPDPRYGSETRFEFDDGWGQTEAAPIQLPTEVRLEKVKSIITRNNSPDIPFAQSINPYRGCEHGCIYCFARPTHAYLDLSPGLDFETKLVAKPNAAMQLKHELSKANYRCQTIAMGTNTDPYQPIERQYRITRNILEVLSETHHPLMIVTKSSLIERDIDLLSSMARRNLVEVFVSITTLDHRLSRLLEPRATAPKRRMEILKSLSDAGIPVGLMFAPVIPVLNDHEMEEVLSLAAQNGAQYAGYIILRLPLEVDSLFESWLRQHYPLKALHVLKRIEDLREGNRYQANFGERMRGTGIFAKFMQQRFQLACKRNGLNRSVHQLATDKFVPPVLEGQQLSFL